ACQRAGHSGPDPLVRNNDKNAGTIISPRRLLSAYVDVGLRGVEAGDRLRFEILFHAVLAPLTAVARLLVAAERCRTLVRQAVEVDVTGADLAGHLAGALDGAGRDVASETIGRLVGDLDR